MRQRKPKMKTWKKVLIWAASIIVVLGVGGLFAANYAMDKMIAQLSASLEDELLEEVIPTPTDAPSGGGDGTVDQPATSEPDGEGSEGQAETDGSAGGQNNQSEVGSKPSPTNGYSAEISTDKAKDVQNKITVSEKAQLASVFLKQLSMDDIKALQELASGGLNLDEKKEARTLILDRLTPEQYDDLIQIAKKYGMSKGKSYEEVSKEK
ncbi:hypothetical protein PAT3040_02703 [Paenibacillus agaridevorans]|uniref:Uncharacterized protein n=1 Tax=Paenibacillus agaridevorans TaxID=171404 RepID=A0A2R5EPW3_9BACL|nr:hypothetical protein [Paenibacillus agaridevorans]GBG08135.1 hypothetical protein PAT3040_02703 [Paenibacillus agaridevorans]